ncbi:MAG: SRPBCC domain-containing protein [Burkholderiaceae bacterium]|nr:SRPBCC domain-containing protein [Burkholderiaceae bacterium]
MIVKSVFLACRPDRAFELFTDQAGLWWPAARRHTKDANSTIRMAAAGRFYERSRDGTEVELGVVRQFEPGKRLVLDWFPGTGPEAPSQVEITFEPVDGGTKVTVRHDRGAVDDAVFGRDATTYDRSWDLVLTSAAAFAC